ncbi:hypothetical protein C8F04DRAFT_1193108 [Mycena alexandri]|uniref:Uncharacterized protein n=1 Tax=Mycena alexandri TaxID=1745969 RepID=A0AAD6SCM2_9AGAR|nr:hypothetical protein C8F04DRAFT_1193108 [Mycena alexandri]
MSLLNGFLLFIALVLAIPFSDGLPQRIQGLTLFSVMQKISDCFSGNKDKCVLFLPFSKDAFVIRMKWLWNAILGVLQWGYANVVRYMLVILVNWYRNTFPRVTAWLLRTDAQTIVNLVREHRQAILITSLICSIPTLRLLPGFFLAALGFGVAGVRRGSLAAGYQRKVYGGFTPAASWFARMESAGMRTTNNPVMELVLVVFSLFAGLLAILAWNLE